MNVAHSMHHKQGYLRHASSTGNVSTAVESNAQRTENQTEWALLPADMCNLTTMPAGNVLNGTEVLKPVSIPSLDVGSQANFTQHTRLQSQASTGRVFFLFMGMTGLDHESHWMQFFQGVEWAKYRLFIHCKYHHACSEGLAMHNPLGLTLIATAPSYYCVDLVSPMVQLLAYALQESNSPADKFVFVSESTLPAKPFAHIYQALMAYQQSDICVGPANEWLGLTLHKNFPPYNDERAYLVKHSQWVVLTAEHAKRMISLWPQVKHGDWPELQWSVPIYHAPEVADNHTGPATTSMLPRGSVATGVRLCADEWAVFATLYGAVVSGAWQVSLPGFGTNVLQMFEHKIQGVCRTFVFWGQQRFGYYPDFGSALVDEIVKDPMTHITCNPRCTGSHPGVFHWVSDMTAHALRTSPYLFVRKFSTDALKLEQFKRIILAS